jgi:hypothetical protein
MIKILKNVLVIAMMINLTNCASTKSDLLAEFKEKTKNIDITDKKQVVLAQHLYNEMKKNK